jgi:hypothetical protein
MTGQINGNNLAVCCQLIKDGRPGAPGAAKAMNQEKRFACAVPDVIHLHTNDLRGADEVLQIAGLPHGPLHRDAVWEGRKQT